MIKLLGPMTTALLLAILAFCVHSYTVNPLIFKCNYFLIFFFFSFEIPEQLEMNLVRQKPVATLGTH